MPYWLEAKNNLVEVVVEVVLPIVGVDRCSCWRLGCNTFMCLFAHLRGSSTGR
jgi:hypothetical protein